MTFLQPDTTFSDDSWEAVYAVLPVAQAVVIRAHIASHQLASSDSLRHHPGSCSGKLMQSMPEKIQLIPSFGLLFADMIE